jgi:hypothetical protein
MIRSLLGTAVVLAALGSALASPVLDLSGVPSGFVPGQAVTFDVLLRDAADLASYNIALTLELAGGSVGTDAYFLMPAAPASRYVFGPDTSYFAASILTAGTTQILTISDFHDPDGNGSLDGVNTVAGVNDRVATVTIATQAGPCGDLSVSFDALTLELDTPLEDPPGVPVPIGGFTALQNDVAAQSPVRVTAVPEPATLSLSVLAFAAAIAGRRRLVRRVG